MLKKYSGIIVFLLGVGFMMASVISAIYLSEPVKQLGPMKYLEQSGGTGRFLFFLFSFGYDLGVILLFLAGLLRSSAGRLRIAWLAGAGVLALVMIPLVPVLLGTGHAPVFFMSGGFLLLIFSVFTGWFWGKERSLLDPAFRPAADMKMTGYLFLLLATWNICGLGGMPFYTLYPDKMMVFQTHSGAIGHMKLIMSYLILGWLFVGLGYYRTWKTGRIKF